MKLRAGFAAIFATVAAAPLPVAAHHSNAMFDEARKVTVQGTVKAFQWTNPHCYIELSVAGDANAIVEYDMEMGAPFYLMNRGWKRNSLKPGDKVIVTFSPLRSGKKGGLVEEVVRADGSPVGAV